MRHLDLCTGIGGFSLAARWAGMDTIGFSEIDPYCCRILEKHFPEIPNYGDIRELDGRTITADLITAGFPCQPYSLAGKQQGSADERDLWPQVRRLIMESQPTWFVGENTFGLVSMALEGVCADLESLGYEVIPVVIPACAVDAPHRRDRLWILAYAEKFRCRPGRARRSQSSGARQPDEALHIVSHAQSNGVERSTRQDGQQNGRSQRPGGLDALGSGQAPADTTSERGQGLGLPIFQRQSRQAGADTHRSGPSAPDTNGNNGTAGQINAGGRETPVVAGFAAGGTSPAHGAGQQMGFAGQSWFDRGMATDFRLTESPLCGADVRVPARVDRLRVLGNAIVPQLAYQILKQIKEIDDGITEK